MILIPICFELSTSFILSAMLEMHMLDFDISLTCPTTSLSLSASLAGKLKIPNFNISLVTGCIPTVWDGLILDIQGPEILAGIALGLGITLPVPKLDLSIGLKAAEIDLSFYTHSTLNVVIPGYAAAEAKIAVTFSFAASTGGFLLMNADPCTTGPITLAGLMNGTISTDRLIKTPPTISFSDLVPYLGSSSSSSSSPDIVHNTPYLLISDLSGGNMPLSDFTYEWSVISEPTSSNVSYDELYNDHTFNQWEIGTILNFDTPGSYVIMITFTSNTYNTIQITENLSVDVV